MANPPSIKEFFRAFGGHWLDRMSGPIGVPLTVLSVFVSNRWASVALMVVGILCLIWTSYRIWSAERISVVALEREAEKIDWRDLQHMLGGMFIENFFMYGGEFNLCKRYQGEFAFEQLKDRFDPVSVRAPRNSTAHIRLQFNGQRGIEKNFAFYVRDGLGREFIIENIYEDQEILLNDNACFGIKFVHDESYKVEKNTNLDVVVHGWKK